MNEIKVGDLVMEVKYPHCEGRKLGHVYPVVGIDKTASACLKCGNYEPRGIHALLEGGLAPLSWLRRIPPLSELESTEHKEEQPA